MKYFFSVFFVFIYFNTQAEHAPCPYHKDEIQSIHNRAAESLCTAHHLTGDVINSYVVTSTDLAWNAVKNHITYSDFSKTFDGMITYCNKKGKFLASNCLYKGISDIGDLYIQLYNNCIANHSNLHSVFERGKINFDKGNIDECLVDMNSLIDAGVGNVLTKNQNISDLLITRGQAFLEVGNYEKAIETLSELINKDPKNKEAYFHASAHKREVSTPKQDPAHLIL